MPSVCSSTKIPDCSSASQSIFTSSLHFLTITQNDSFSWIKTRSSSSIDLSFVLAHRYCIYLKPKYEFYLKFIRPVSIPFHSKYSPAFSVFPSADLCLFESFQFPLSFLYFLQHSYSVQSLFLSETLTNHWTLVELEEAQKAYLISLKTIFFSNLFLNSTQFSFSPQLPTKPYREHSMKV